MTCSEVITRGGARIRFVVDSCEVHRGECITGWVEAQTSDLRRGWVPDVRLALQSATVRGNPKSESKRTVVVRHQLESTEPRRFRFSLDVPVSTLLGSARLVLKTGGGITALMPALQMPLNIMPERYLTQVVDLIASTSDHWVASWASAGNAGSIYVQLFPGEAMQERAFGMTVELSSLGLHLKGSLSLRVVTRKSWLDSREASFGLDFETKLRGVTSLEPDLTSLRPQLETFFRSHLGDERQLPIPHAPDDNSDELPIPTSLPGSG